MENLEDIRNSIKEFNFVYGISDSKACLCVDDKAES